MLRPVKTAVADKATVDEVLDLSKKLKKQLKAQNKEIAKLRGSFFDLHQKYDAKPAEIQAYIEKMITATKEGQAHILDTRSAMQNLMTKEEWTAVFSNKDD